jgi:D-serine deaminase-like pyridoxal phosphate-dependent protein
MSTPTWPPHEPSARSKIRVAERKESCKLTPKLEEWLGRDRNDIDTPALLIDLDLMEENLRRMAAFFADRPSALRPHTKTHKCPALAHKQLEAGAAGICCAKLGEAEVMADAGISDILIANEVVGPRKMDRLMQLAWRADVMVEVDDAENVEDLSAAAVAHGVRPRVLVEVNIGHNRCGVEPGEAALALARKVAGSAGLRFAGLAGYEGHLVLVKDRAQREEGCRLAMQRLLGSRELIEHDGIPVGIVSAGGTGTYDITGAWPGVTEVQAGSYVLMDTSYRQLDLGFGCALSVLSTIMSVPANGRAVADAGMKAMSCEFGEPGVKDRADVRVGHLSEEHTILDLDRPGLRLGEKVEFIPSHVCTTVNLHTEFYGIRKGKVECVWEIAGRGMFR